MMAALARVAIRQYTFQTHHMSARDSLIEGSAGPARRKPFMLRYGICWKRWTLHPPDTNAKNCKHLTQTHLCTHKRKDLHPPNTNAPLHPPDTNAKKMKVRLCIQFL